jgi:hypothetical protein
MITTIPTYCKERGVTRQFVYSYIKSGKFKHFEMPVFIELNGDKITLGMQKVLEVPDAYAPKKSDLTPITEASIGNLDELLTRLTDDSDLKNLYHQLLTTADKKTARTQLEAAIAAHSDPDRLRIAEDEASIRLLQHMKQTSSFLQNFLEEARSAVVQTA